MGINSTALTGDLSINNATVKLRLENTGTNDPYHDLISDSTSFRSQDLLDRDIIKYARLGTSSSLSLGVATNSNVFIGDQNGNSTVSVQNNKIIDVEPGTNPTDAVNLSQLSAVSSNIIAPSYYTFATTFAGAQGRFNFNGPTPRTASQIRMTILNETGTDILYVIERANNTLILIIRSTNTVKIFRLISQFGFGSIYSRRRSLFI